jgi:uncharacterized membrane protein HdeD (DUF308 family)
MQKWTRWQDYVALVVGVYAFLAPIWTETTTTATWALVVLGVVTAVVSLWSLAEPGSVASEWVHAVMGVLLFVSPWVMGFNGTDGIAWTAWIAGVITFVVGLAALPASKDAHDHGAGLAASH